MLASLATFTLGFGALLLGDPDAQMEAAKETETEIRWYSKFPFDVTIINTRNKVKEEDITLRPKEKNDEYEVKFNKKSNRIILGVRQCTKKRDDVRGTPYEEYEVQFKGGRFYDIEMRADAPTFFPCLRLEKDGRQVKSASSRDKADDESADEYRPARMTYFCRETGKFKIIATNYSGALDTFELKVRERAPRIYPKVKAEDVFTRIADKELTGTDPKDSVLKQSPCKIFLFELKRDFTYDIELRAGFDTVLRLEDDAGQELAFNDDRPLGPDAAGVQYTFSETDSRITFKCPRTATYRVIATSLNRYYQNAAANANVGYGRFELVVAKVIKAKDFTKADVEKFIKDVMETKIEKTAENANKIVYRTPEGYFHLIYDRAAKTVTFALPYKAPPEKAKRDAWNMRGKNSSIKKSKGPTNGDVYEEGTVYFAGNPIPCADGISFAKLEESYLWFSQEEPYVWLSQEELDISNPLVIKNFTTAHVEKFITGVMKTTGFREKPEFNANKQIVYLTLAGFDVIYDPAKKTVSFAYPYGAPPEEAKRDAWNKKGKKSRIEVSNGDLYKKKGTVYFAGNPISYADGISFAKLKQLHDQRWREKQEFDNFLKE